MSGSLLAILFHSVIRFLFDCFLNSCIGCYSKINVLSFVRINSIIIYSFKYLTIIAIVYRMTSNILAGNFN